MTNLVYVFPTNQEKKIIAFAQLQVHTFNNLVKDSLDFSMLFDMSFKDWDCQTYGHVFGKEGK